IGGGAVGLFLPMRASSSATTNEIPAVLMRAIPSSGEKLPVIGLGTWQTFDIDPASAQRKALDEVLSSFVKLGGKLVDSSPMYGRAEETIGDIAARLHLRDSLFLATKVWIRGKQAGIESMERSLVRLQTERIDLMQVHNLVDVETQLSTIKAWKNERRFRYIGVTHYEEGGHAAVENVLRRESVDF